MQTFAGMPVSLMPSVVLDASFALTSSELARKFEAGQVSGRSSLVILGEGVRVKGLDLDGALVIRAGPGVELDIEDLKVRNQGWEFVPLDQRPGAEEGTEAPEVLRIRGFDLVKKETLVIEVTEPGKWIVNAGGKPMRKAD